MQQKQDERYADAIGRISRMSPQSREQLSEYLQRGAVGESPSPVITKLLQDIPLDIVGQALLDTVTSGVQFKLEVK